MVFFKETIFVSSKIEELRIKMGFAQCFSVDRIGRSRGLVVFWHTRADCFVSSYSQNHVDVIFNKNNVSKWRLSCFHGMLESNRSKQS